jgi:hypothetical protein
VRLLLQEVLLWHGLILFAVPVSRLRVVQYKVTLKMQYYILKYHIWGFAGPSAACAASLTATTESSAAAAIIPTTGSTEHRTAGRPSEATDRSAGCLYVKLIRHRKQHSADFKCIILFFEIFLASFDICFGLCRFIEWSLDV